MHIHTSPDVSPRKCSDIGLAKRLQAAGMGGALVKSHGNDTAPRAALLNEQFPELFFAGSIVLNRQAGGLNPFAVRACGKMGGRFVWFPTMDSLSYQQFHHKDKKEVLPEGLIYLLDDNGEVKKEALEVLEAAAEYDMAVATGHVSAEEGFAAACAARKMGLTAVMTHADLPSNAYSHEMQKRRRNLASILSTASSPLTMTVSPLRRSPPRSGQPAVTTSSSPQTSASRSPRTPTKASRCTRSSWKARASLRKSSRSCSGPCRSGCWERPDENLPFFYAVDESRAEE